MTVDESGPEANIQVQATMPVGCLPQYADVCELTLELAYSKDMYQAKQCVGRFVGGLRF